ncbi:SsgA family sporulation/cell division regulator [Streptomyces sp. NPDC055056]
MSDGRSPVPLEMTLEYSAEQPFSVTLTVSACAVVAEWNLSRDQLIKGCRQHQGWGDVAVWPSVRNRGEDAVRIRLGPMPSPAVLEIERKPLSAWLHETLQLISQGSESGYLALDDVISRLLDPDE